MITTSQREILKSLIFSAPDPCGFPVDYFNAWNNARVELERTCPGHVNESGTCPHCHKDMQD
jgi:hypothetical protein